MLQGIMKVENEIWRRKVYTKICFNRKKKMSPKIKMIEIKM